jgi:hypothetical protein
MKEKNMKEKRTIIIMKNRRLKFKKIKKNIKQEKQNRSN